MMVWSYTMILNNLASSQDISWYTRLIAYIGVVPLIMGLGGILLFTTLRNNIPNKTAPSVIQRSVEPVVLFFMYLNLLIMFSASKLEDASARFTGFLVSDLTHGLLCILVLTQRTFWNRSLSIILEAGVVFTFMMKLVSQYVCIVT